MLPIESSLIGPIAETHDLLYGSPLSIVREATLPIRHCLLGLPGATLERREGRSLAPGCARPVPRAAPRLAAALHPAADDRRRGARGGRSRAIRRSSPSRASRPPRPTGSRSSPTTSATSRARSHGSSHLRRTRSVARRRRWRTALSFVTDHRPGALYRALGAARARRRQPRAARLATAAELAVALPLRRGARRPRLRPTSSARRSPSCAQVTRELRVFGSYACRETAMSQNALPQDLGRARRRRARGRAVAALRSTSTSCTR